MKPVAESDAVLMAGLTRQEKYLMTQMSDASKGRNWQKVKSLWSQYAGSSFPVFCAAMQAAITCGKYAEAAELHCKLWEESPRPNSSIPYSLGIKIYGRIGQNGTVQSIWREAKRRNLVDEFVAGCQIDAAAELGDMTGAAEGLDYMLCQGFQVGVDRFNSAINACKNCNDTDLVENRSKAAMFLLQEMVSRRLKPNQVTFGSLLGAHVGAPLEQTLTAWSTMKGYGVKPNEIVGESCLTAILGRIEPETFGVKGLALELQNRTRERRAAAQAFLAEMKAAKAPLTYLCGSVDKALQRID